MTFTVQVTDSNGCIDFDDVRINVFIANAGNDTIICSGDTIQGFIYGDPATTLIAPQVVCLMHLLTTLCYTQLLRQPILLLSVMLQAVSTQIPLCRYI